MNHGIKQISIPQPCSQSWADMDMDDQGRFCNSCQKTVTDFTKLSNKQVFDALLSAGKVCGRFDQHQLTALNSSIIEPVSRFSWKKLSLVMAFTGLVPFVRAEVKVKVKIEQGLRDVKTKVPLLDTIDGPRVITGRVVSATDKLPLPGVSIKLKGTSIGVATDVDGNFTLDIPANIKDPVGVALFIGFETKMFNIEGKTSQYSIALKESSNTLMGEVVVIKKPPLWKRPYYAARRLIHKIFS